MVDNKQDNDEYEFADLDVMSPELMGDPDTDSKPAASSAVREPGKTDVKRNALIVVVLVVLAMLLYKFMGSFFSGKNEPVKSDVSPTSTVSQPAMVVTKPVIVEQTPVIVPVATTPVSAPVDNSAVNQKLASMDLNQQTIRSDVNNVSNQLGGINTNITALNNKIANLGQMVTTLSNTVEQQSIQIAHLIEVRAKQKVRPVMRHNFSKTMVYFIQAVIPGRAWLIATNGSTLTVREGTKVAGYGIVKLIDPVQGRVIMSSGRVIRFSQQDS